MRIPLLLFALTLPTALPAATAYVSDERGNSITVIDTITLKPIATWEVGKRPRGILLSKD